MQQLRKWALATLAGALLVAGPALADSWTANNVNVTVIAHGHDAQSSEGAQATSASSGAAAASSLADENADDGVQYSGSGSWTVSRVYTKDGSPPNKDVTLTLSVSVEAEAGGHTGQTAYADARAKGDPDAHWGGLRHLDKSVAANYAPGQNPTDSDDTTMDTGTVASLAMTDTVSAVVYVYADAFKNGAAALGSALANSAASFSN
jgi:hypothetical protein